jgi:flagellar export protein FliJ
MSQFHFRLATLLRLREVTRDRRRVELAEAHRADEDLRGQLGRLSAEQRRLQDKCRRAAGPGAVDVDELVEAHRYAAALRAEEEGLRQKRHALAAEIDRRRQTLVAADRDVQVLEKLRERRQALHRLEEERQLAKQLDEAALQTQYAGATP